jgi:hypothetical protein
MENFLKSTKGYLNAFRSTGEHSKTKQSNIFSPTFVGDVYEQSVDEVDLEEGRIHTTDNNIFSSPVYKFNPETSEALEVSEEHVPALTTLNATTLPDKPFEKSTATLHSASSFDSSPSDEETNEADREDDSSLANTELESESIPNPTLADFEPTVVESETTAAPESDREDRSEDSQTQLNVSGSSFGSPSLQRDIIQPASADLLAALSFLQSTEEKDPSPVEASENTEVVANLKEPSDNTPDDEVSFPDLVALISEIETSFDEAKDDASQGEESYNTAVNLPQSETDSLRGEPITQGVDSPFVPPQLPSEDIPDLCVNEEDPVPFEEQPTFCASNLSKSPLRELESLARQVLQGSHESSSHLSVENPFEAVQHSETSEVKESSELDTNEESESIAITEPDFKRQIDFEETVVPREVTQPDTSEHSQTGQEAVIEKASAESDYNESARSEDSTSLAEELAASTDADSIEDIKSELKVLSQTEVVAESQSHFQPDEVVAVEEVVAEEEGQSAVNEETFEPEKEQEPVVSEAREPEAAVTEDQDIAEGSEVDCIKQTQSEEPAQAQVVEPTVREAQEEVAQVDSIEQTKPEEAQSQAVEPGVTESSREEVSEVVAVDSIEPAKSEEPVAAKSQAVEPAVVEAPREEVSEVAALDSVEQTKQEESVVAELQAVGPVVTEAPRAEAVSESQAVKPRITDASGEEVSEVTAFDSIEQTQPEEPVVAESQAVEPAVTEVPRQEVSEVLPLDSIEPAKSEEPVAEKSQVDEPAVAEAPREEVSKAVALDSIEQTHPEKLGVAEAQTVETDAERKEVSTNNSVEQATSEEPVFEVAHVEERAQVEGEVQEVGATTHLDNEQANSEEPFEEVVEEVTTEVSKEDRFLVQEKEITALVESVAKEQSQLDPLIQELKERIAVSEISASITVTKNRKEENMQVRDASFAEEKKDEEDMAQVLMEPGETNLTETGKTSSQMSAPEVGPVAPPKAEGRDDDRSESNDVVVSSLDASISGPHSTLIVDAIDRRSSKTKVKSPTPHSDRSSPRPAEDHVVKNQASPRTPVRTKSPPRERSKTPIQDRPLLDKKESLPKKKLTEYIRKDLWNRKKPELVLEAINAVAEAAIQPESRSAIARAGGLLALIRAMEDHVNDVAIQIAACSALERLALDPENEIAIAEIGGVDAVLGAMMCHFKNAELHEAAWSTLWNLTCVNSAEEMTIDTAGGMQAIVSCMKQHINNPMVQKNACGALTNLCLHSEARLEALSDAGGFVAISSALQKHFKNPEVRKQASFALTSLLESHAGQYEADHGM